MRNGPCSSERIVSPHVEWEIRKRGGEAEWEVEKTEKKETGKRERERGGTVIPYRIKCSHDS